MEGEASVAESDKTDEFLFKILDSEEYTSLNDSLRGKIESAIQERISAFLVQEALHQSSKTELGKSDE